MNTKKLFLGTGIIVAGAVLSFAMIAGVKAESSTKSSDNAAKTTVQIESSGKALVRGTIDSVSTGSIVVKSWGGSWTVNVGSSAEILPASVSNDITKFKAGDFIGVQGTINTSSSWTIDATIVRDWTYVETAKVERKQNIETAKNTIKSQTARNYVGVASNVTESSLTLTVNGTAYTVNFASGAQVVNRNWITITATDIQTNDNVRVWGVNASSTITAEIVRDVTLPVSTSNH